jgi:hypothetical protein
VFIIIPSFKKTVLADLTLIKVLRQKEKFRFVRQIWLAPNLVFSIIPPFLNKHILLRIIFSHPTSIDLNL